MRLAIPLAILLTAAAGEAAARDHFLVQWVRNDQCEVLLRLPFFGSHYRQLGVYSSRWEADRALEASRKRRDCPPPPPAEDPPAHAPAPPAKVRGGP